MNNACQAGAISARRRTIVSFLCFVSLQASVSAADLGPPVIPAGTRLKFHVVERVSSDESKTGQTFAFELREPIVLSDRAIPVGGTVGTGTVYLAGRAGTSGHEGDLTLRLDTLKTADGVVYAFSDARFKIDGRNRKVTSSVVGLIPFLGIGGRFIRGSDTQIDATTAIETVLDRPALPSTGGASL